MKPKPCKYSKCGKSFTPFNSLQQVCPNSIDCALGYNEEKKAKKRQAVTRKMRAEFNAKDRSYQLKKAQEAFNAFIRERDKHQPCISCGTTNPGLRYDAGHYRTIGAHPELRFHEDNCFRQCHYNCNINRSGNIVDYRIGLVDRIGRARVDRLEGAHKPKNYTLDEVIEIKIRYRAKLKELQQARAA